MGPQNRSLRRERSSRPWSALAGPGETDPTPEGTLLISAAQAAFRDPKTSAFALMGQYVSIKSKRTVRLVIPGVLEGMLG